MNKQEFISYLEDPAKIQPGIVPQLKELLKAYPAFQTGHVLLLKSLYESNDVLYEKYLTRIAAYAGNRELLYDYILGKHNVLTNEPERQPSEMKEVRDQEDEKANPSTTAEEDIKGEPHKEQKIKSETEKPEKPEPPAEAEKKQVHKTDKNYFDSVTISSDYFNITDIGRRIESDDKFDGVHSFSQWLDIMNRKPREAGEEMPVQPDKKWELIDNFINTNKGFVPSKEKPVDKDGMVHDLSEQSISDKDEFMTETLARIYIKQRNFDKALHIFQKLSLKYPEKSVYFAGQIKIVEQLKNNEK